MDAQPKRTPWFWPIVLVAGGVLLLLHNLLLVDFDVIAYWPVLLVLLAIQLLLRGDIALTWQAHTFGITRGSVQSASLEVESGELDVQIRALRRPGRLIAGQYTARSRPALNVRHNHATLKMQRGQTWWLSLADWDVGLTQDLPWDLLVSSYLGRLEIDLRGLVVQRAYAASGLGSVHLACPEQASGPLFARSTFGDVRLSIPEESTAIIHTQASPFGRVRVDLSRFTQIEPGVYATTGAEPPAADLTIRASTVFGSIYIS
jgi:hypothetical protein